MWRRRTAHRKLSPWLYPTSGSCTAYACATLNSMACPPCCFSRKKSRVGIVLFRSRPILSSCSDGIFSKLLNRVGYFLASVSAPDSLSQTTPRKQSGMPLKALSFTTSGVHGRGREARASTRERSMAASSAFLHRSSSVLDWRVRTSWRRCWRLRHKAFPTSMASALSFPENSDLTVS